MTSVADELRENGLTPKRLGDLLTLSDEKSTQTTIETASQEISCLIPTQTELRQETEINEMEERLHYALQDTERLGEILTQNQLLQNVIEKKDEKIKELADREEVAQRLSEQYAASLQTMEEKIESSEQTQKNLSETLQEKLKINEKLTGRVVNFWVLQ